jgi:hypothetical protein
MATAAKRHEERATISSCENTLYAVLTRWLIIVSLLAFCVMLPTSGPDARQTRVLRVPGLSDD